MKTSTVTEEQLVQLLREAATGDPSIVTGCRAYGIAENTVYTAWRRASDCVVCAY